jgi:hypothetical protein
VFRRNQAQQSFNEKTMGIKHGNCMAPLDITCRHVLQERRHACFRRADYVLVAIPELERNENGPLSSSAASETYWCALVHRNASHNYSS